MVLSLAACGKSGTPSSPSSPDKPGTSPAKPVEIVFAISNTPNGLDPISEDNQNTIMVCSTFYDRLVEIRAADNSWAPGAAKGWKQVDETTWEFEINLDHKFSNGEQLTMDDVKFSIERLATIPKSADAFKGIAGISYQGNILTIKLNKPNNTIIPQIIYMCVIVNKKYIESGGDEAVYTKPIGTGPYTVTSFTPGGDLVVEARADYPFGKAQIDKITFKAIPEVQARYIAVETGQAQFAGILSPMELKLAEEKGTFTIINKTSQRSVLMTLNTEKPPFNDVNLRRAMAYALDRDSIAALNGGRVPIKSPLFGGFPAYYHEPVNLPEYNPEKAKQLFEAAGISPANPLTVTFYYWQPEPGIEFYQAELLKLGVNLDTQMVEFSVYLNHEATGDFDIVFTGSRNQAGSYLMDTQRVNSNFIGSRNIARWVNADAMTLVEEMLVSTDQERIKALGVQLADLVGDQCPIIPWILNPAICVMDKKLTGVEVRGDLVVIIRGMEYHG